MNRLEPKHFLVPVWYVHPHLPNKQCLTANLQGDVTEVMKPTAQPLIPFTLIDPVQLCATALVLALIIFHLRHLNSCLNCLLASTMSSNGQPASPLIFTKHRYDVILLFKNLLWLSIINKVLTS